MKRASWLLPLALALVPVLSGCGGVGASSSGTNPPNPPAVVAVAISETHVLLGAGEGHQFTATVTGTDNTAVTWSVTNCTGSACGSITSNGYYTAPSQVPTESWAVILATSQADPGKYATAGVWHEPVDVKVDQAGAWLTPGGTYKFTATVGYDIDQLGVTWSLACSDTICGVLSDATLTTVVYTAPSVLSGPPVVTLKANSVKDSNKSSEVVISVKMASSETLAEGNYAFVFDGWKTNCPPTGCDAVRAALTGQFHADGNGLITGGIEDINVATGSSETLAITGSYQVESDRRGTLILTSSKGTATYRMSVAASGREGTFISFDQGAVNGMILGSGSFEKQEPNAFSLPALAGPYAVGLFGVDYQVWGAENQSAIGRFEANAAGILSNGRMDLQRSTGSNKTIYNIGTYHAVSYNLGGTFSAPSMDTGRGSATLNFISAESGEVGTLHFAYYIVSADKILLVGTDSPVPKISNSGPILSGEARRQAGPFSSASLAGPSIFSMTATVLDPWGFATQDAVVGQLVSDGHGSLSGVLDSTGNEMQGAGYPSVLNQAFTASYGVDPDGRAVFNKIPAGKSDSQIAYLFGQNQGFLMDETAGFARFGRIEPQDEGPFDASSISGPLVLAVNRVTSLGTEIAAGWILFDQKDGMSIVVDAESLGSVNKELLSIGRTYYVTGAYTVASNGRGTFNFTSSQVPNAQGLAFWVASPSKVVALAKFDSWWPVLMEFR
ncbi:MAG: hypothetical protein KGL37_11140 [Acidobacteriota bacterium]|nr:hypothetical protein [Acidobacteriota bacterium]